MFLARRQRGAHIITTQIEHPAVLAPCRFLERLGVEITLNQMARQYETAIIVVTHDEKIIPTFKRIYHICDDRAQEENVVGAEAAPIRK